MDATFRRRGAKRNEYEHILPHSGATRPKLGRRRWWRLMLLILGIIAVIGVWDTKFREGGRWWPVGEGSKKNAGAKAIVRESGAMNGTSVGVSLSTIKAATFSVLPSPAMQTQAISSSSKSLPSATPTLKPLIQSEPKSKTSISISVAVSTSESPSSSVAPSASDMPAATSVSENDYLGEQAQKLKQESDKHEQIQQQQDDLINQALLEDGQDSDDSASDLEQENETVVKEQEHKEAEKDVQKVDQTVENAQAKKAENRKDTEKKAKEAEEKKKAAEKKKKLKHVNQNDITPVYIFPTLPSSSVWCEGTNRNSRICRFRNLCYHPKHQEFFILQTNRTVQQNVPLHRFHEGLLELSTVADHSRFFFNFVEVSPFNEKFRNIPVRYEEKLHFMFSRLHPRNIMHNLHDDVLGMYFTLKQYVGKGSQSFGMPFSLDTHRILIYDPYGPTDSTRPYEYLSKEPLRFKAYLEMDEDIITCFRDAVVGNTKMTTWYQYGFKTPQGPIKGKTPNGMHVREVAEWFVRRIGLELGVDEVYDRLDGRPKSKASSGEEVKDINSNGTAVDFPETDLIVLLSRKSNRLILNEKDLTSHLTKTYNLPVQIVTNEEHSFEEQVKFMRRARIVLGMHGSIMIMTMFCRRGTVVVEMFPFGVPSENYTPYRTLAELPGMALVYRAWEQTDESQCTPHPTNHPLLGGIDTLPPSKQQEVLETKRVPKHICCDNPFWLYRIYQDTTINLPEITSLINSGLAKSRTFLADMQSYNINWEETDLLAPPVTTITCLDGPQREEGELWAEWDVPWTGAKIEKWSILIGGGGKMGGKEYWARGEAPKLAIKGFESRRWVEFWVRPVVGNFKGEWGKKGRCLV